MTKAKQVEVEFTPTNYSPADAQLESHLEAADTALSNPAPINVRKAGVDVGSRVNLNFDEAGGVSVVVVEVPIDNEVKATIDTLALMPRDGSRPFTGDVNVNGRKLLNVAEAQGVNTLAARKATAGTLAKGSAVYPVGFDVGNNWFLLEAAKADVLANTPAVAIVDSDVTDTVTGFVRISGELLNLDTSSWSVGDELFLSTTAGELTNVQPVGFSVAIQPVAEVLSSDITTGILLITGPWHMERLPQMSAASRVWVSDGSGTPTETDPAGAFAPATHASDHEIGGSDLISHQSITGSGTNTHAQIDTHVGIVAGNPHGADLGNIGSGTLAELNTAVTDATLIADTRNLTAGAGLTGGGDQSADRTLDVVANADASVVVNANDIQVGVLATDAQHGDRGRGSLHTNATISEAGFMSASDKVLNNLLTTAGSAATWLDGTGAYSAPTAAEVGALAVDGSNAMGADLSLGGANSLVTTGLNDLAINAPLGQEVDINVNGVTELAVSSTTIDAQSNAITTTGAITGNTINGASITAGGVVTDYLDGTGAYSVPPGQLVAYDASLGLSTTTSLTFINKLSFTTASLDAGNYDIVVHYLWGYTNSNNNFVLRTTVDASIVGAEIVTEPADSDTAQTYPVSLSYQETLGAGTHDIEVDFRADVSGTARIQRVEVRVYST